MKKKYVLNGSDLLFIFTTRLTQVKGGFEWFYQPNKDFPDNLSPKDAGDITNISIEVFEESFKRRFGTIEPKIVDYRLSAEQKKAILELYPNAHIISFKEMYGHTATWFLFDRYKKKLSEPSVTTHGENVIRPRWLSVLSDLLCVFTFGIIKPKRRSSEKCLGDLLR